MYGLVNYYKVSPLVTNPDGKKEFCHIPQKLLCVPQFNLNSLLLPISNHYLNFYSNSVLVFLEIVCTQRYIPRYLSLVLPIKKIHTQNLMCLLSLLIPSLSPFFSYYLSEINSRAQASWPQEFHIVWILLVTYSCYSSTCSSFLYISYKLAARTRNWI